jgi:predicted DNA-binding ribbon-helix-helix protein
MTIEGLKDLLSTPVLKRSVMIAGHASSVTIEEPFWNEFKALAKAQGKSINQLVTELDDARNPKINLSSAVRLYVLNALK